MIIYKTLVILSLFLCLKLSQTFSQEGEVIVFYSNDISFSPLIQVIGNAEILWTWADGTTDNTPHPTKNYGVAGNRKNTLKVTPWSALKMINIGYTAEDGGPDSIPRNTSQNVTLIENLNLASTSLQTFCASYNKLKKLDFSNFINLEIVECFLCDSISSVNLTNTPKLRRICFEKNNLPNLDLTDCIVLEDFRGALNQFKSVNYSNSTDELWHICVRDNPLIMDRNMFNYMERFPNITELFIWNSNQKDTLKIPKSHDNNKVDIIAHNNNFTTLDLRGALQNQNVKGTVYMYNNMITEVKLEGCDQITEFDLHNNLLNSNNVDYILAKLDSFGRSSGFLDLTKNASPSLNGINSMKNLELKGWVVNTDSGIFTSQLPDPPTNIKAYAGNGKAILTFTKPLNNGSSAIISYTVISNPGNITSTQQAEDTLTINGLMNNISYTFTVTANNSEGSSLPSQPSNSVIPELFAETKLDPDNLIVLRVGNGSNTLNTESAQVSLLEYNLTQENQTEPIKTITIGSDISSQRLTLCGISKNEGQLNLSTNGQYICFIGYDQPKATSTSNCIAGNKIICRVDFTGIHEFSSPFLSNTGTARNVASIDGTTFYTNIANNSVGIFPYSSNILLNTNYGEGSRSIQFFNNQLYSLLNYGKLTYSKPGIPTNSSTSSIDVFTPNLDNIGFVFLDISTTINWNSTGFDLIYIGNCGGGLAKFYWNGTQWISAGTSNKLPYNVSGLIATKNEKGAIIYAISGNGTNENNALLEITDTCGLAGNISAGLPTRILATAGSNFIFKGVCFSPIPVPGSPKDISAISGDGQATVMYNAPSNTGGSEIISYTAVSIPGNITSTVNRKGSGTITVTGLTNGTSYNFIVYATNSFGSGSMSEYSNSITPSAVINFNETISNKISIFPNPADNFIAIKLGNDIKVRKTVITITDIQGKQLLYTESLNSKDIFLNLKNFKAGNYFLKVVNENSSEFRKFLIAH